MQPPNQSAVLEHCTIILIPPGHLMVLKCAGWGRMDVVPLLRCVLDTWCIFQVDIDFFYILSCSFV